MELTNRSQPIAQSFASFTSAQYMPQMIEPCATVLNERGEKVPSDFHLLSCGHIVAVYDVDQRCGRNCQHAVTTIACMEKDLGIPSASAHRMLEETTIQTVDILFCETCNGIPLDRYQRMHLEPDGRPSTIRRALAVTRAILYSLLEVPVGQVDGLFCFPYFCSTVEECDGQHAHKLRCGHLVWSPTARSCAANCADWASAHRATPLTWERQGDAILCHECEGRAAQVHRRFAQEGLGKERLPMRDIFG